MLAYAQDAQESDTPWVNWEFQNQGIEVWRKCTNHPEWKTYHDYRRAIKTIRIGEFTLTIGSRWQTKETPRLRGTLFALDVTENSVSLQLEETEDFRGGLANKLTWVSTAQDLAEKWECLPNAIGEAQPPATKL
jgi:hypothetical protein